MNLELLDPFGRQIPDRIDSTLHLPAPFHFRQVQAGTINASEVTEEARGEYKSAYHLSFNRRGSYIATAYGSGTVAVHSLLSRQVVSLIPHHDTSVTPKQPGLGATSLSWSRRSRHLLIGASGDLVVRLVDTSHPYGPDVFTQALAEEDDDVEEEGSTAAAINTSVHGGSNYHPSVSPTTEMMNSVASTQGKTGNNDATASAADSVFNPAVAAAVALASTATGTAQTASVFAADLNIMSAPLMDAEARTRKSTYLVDPDDQYIFSKETRSVETHILRLGDIIPSAVQGTAAGSTDSPRHKQKRQRQPKASANVIPRGSYRYPIVSMTLHDKVGGSLQIHPRLPTMGLSVLANGSLVVFAMPPSVFYTQLDNLPVGNASSAAGGGPASESPTALVVTLCGGGFPHTASSSFTQQDNRSSAGLSIACAAFDPHNGYRIYAVTQDGQTLLGYEIDALLRVLQKAFGRSSSAQDAPLRVPVVQPFFQVSIPSSSVASDNKTSLPGGASVVWHLLVSRNGKSLVLNCADGTLKVYETEALWKTTGKSVAVKPTCVFQDVVNKVKFASCDFSGDGEYLVGLSNGGGTSLKKYALSVWNTRTGTLIDQLTGSSVLAYAVAWHPTRAWIAVAASDGLVDVWGLRLPWTAFAPDFQALQKNIEYVEREDEFDVDAEGNFVALDDEGEAAKAVSNDDGGGSNVAIDVLTVAPVPVFASDSEDERDVFEFPVRLRSTRMRDATKRDADD
jgi:WD40 repeat protein